ncbi:DMT family transporter [Pikeienuella sp. HZG-20]|uniref:DMT family transporter n=1 Tax=Paludibacillus litoralis TaxID=3133267 RepID=UPI0030EF1CAB
MAALENNNIRGVVFMLATTVIFALQDGLSKALAAEHSPIFITMWRYWAFGGVCLILLWRTGFRNGMRSGQPALQIFRGVTLALEICIAILAFDILGLARSHAIFAFGPLLVVALSGPLLGEKIGWRRWTAIGTGFLGMLLIIRPGSEAISYEMGVALVGMVMFALYGIATRRVARTDAAITSFYYTGVCGAVVVTLIGPWFWSSMTPIEILMMAALCCTGMIGHYLLIRAFEAAEASAIQPFAYFQTVFSSFIGVTVFSEVISPWTIAGGAIVIGAGVFAFWREHVRAKQRAARAAEDDARQLRVAVRSSSS